MTYLRVGVGYMNALGWVLLGTVVCGVLAAICGVIQSKELREALLGVNRTGFDRASDILVGFTIFGFIILGVGGLIMVAVAMIRYS